MVDGVNTLNNTPTISTNVTEPTQQANASTVDYDAFLSLLVTQLKNQDPTEPTDNAQLMSQLASFSSVEQQIQINERLDTLISSNLLGDAGNLIGKTLTSADGVTSGVVSSVILEEQGILAELESGERIPVVPSVRISEGQ
ncbi:MAG: flagellar hook assembly protein FlgD [Pseudomonadota bacterium]